MPEVVAQSNLITCPYTSGGGFSSYYPTPLYQSANVKNYLALVVNDTALRPVPGYNGAGRGYPDVTMQGYYDVTLSGDQLWLSSGTSASCPAMAGVLSTLNAARMRIGKGAVGFVHPALYKHASKFVNDVVGGNNKCTQNSQICCSQGFYATPGWDPASGLGSINYRKMEAVFLALGNEANALTPFPPSTSVTARPTLYPAARLTSAPTLLKSLKPTSIPSSNPTARTTFYPSALPTTAPPSFLSIKPTSYPSRFPTLIPSSVPTSSPSATPSAIPSVSPTLVPTMTPSSVPTSSPSATPSVYLSGLNATFFPSMEATMSSRPSKKPVLRPTRKPSRRSSLRSGVLLVFE